MYRFSRPELRMQAPPRCSYFHVPQDGVKYQAVILTLPASGVSTGLCQHRPDYGPLFICDVVSVHTKQQNSNTMKSLVFFRNSP